MRLDKASRNGWQPSMSLAEFGLARGIGRGVMRNRTERYPLPAPAYYARRNSREVAFYSIASLEHWYSQWRDIQPPRGKAS